MKKVEFYPKSGVVTIVVTVVLLTAVGIGVIFLPDSVKRVLFDIGTIQIFEQNYNAFTDTLLFEIVYFSLVAYSAYIFFKDFGKRKPEMVLSEGGIYCLPVDCHPMTISWGKIQNISLTQNRIGSPILVLSTPEYIPEEYQERKTEIRCNLARIPKNPEKIYQVVKQFHSKYKGGR